MVRCSILAARCLHEEIDLAIFVVRSAVEPAAADGTSLEQPWERLRCASCRAPPLFPLHAFAAMAAFALGIVNSLIVAVAFVAGRQWFSAIERAAKQRASSAYPGPGNGFPNSFREGRRPPGKSMKKRREKQLARHAPGWLKAPRYAI
jgi:hypothetical protein